MSQTVINKFGPAAAIAGQLSDNMEGVDVVSRFSAETSTQIPFGTGVKANASSHGVNLISNNADNVEGLVVWGFNHQPANAALTIGDLGATGLLPKASLQVLRRGRMYALLDPSVASVTPYTDRGFVRNAANGGNTQPGALSNVSDPGNNIDCTRQILFVGNVFTAADGVTKIAEVEVDFTNRNS